MNHNTLATARHIMRRKLPGGQTWEEFDEAVYKAVVGREVLNKLSDNVGFATAHDIQVFMNLPNENYHELRLSLFHLMTKRRLRSLSTGKLDKLYKIVSDKAFQQMGI